MELDFELLPPNRGVFVHVVIQLVRLVNGKFTCAGHGGLLERNGNNDEPNKTKCKHL